MSDEHEPPEPAWRGEFPYQWTLDEAVARRELLRFAVYTSGALFGCAVGLAALGKSWSPRVQGPRREVIALDALPRGEAHYFRYPGPDDEAVLIHLPSGHFVAFSQRCTHLSCSVEYQPERSCLYCPCHEGMFDPASGVPTAGPPQRPLARIALELEGGRVFAVGVG